MGDALIMHIVVSGERIVKYVILSEAKNLEEPAGREGGHQILRFAQNDTSGPVFYNMRWAVDRREISI
jgi:hypothetical protein